MIGDNGLPVNILHNICKEQKMKNLVLVLVCVFVAVGTANAALVMQQDFEGYAVGTSSEALGWTTESGVAGVVSATVIDSGQSLQLNQNSTLSVGVVAPASSAGVPEFQITLNVGANYGQVSLDSNASIRYYVYYNPAGLTMGVYNFGTGVDDSRTIDVAGLGVIDIRMAWDGDAYSGEYRNHGDTAWSSISDGTQAYNAPDTLSIWSAVGSANPHVDSIKTNDITLVPEPATMSLIGLGAFVMIRRKK